MNSLRSDWWSNGVNHHRHKQGSELTLTHMSANTNAGDRIHIGVSLVLLNKIFQSSRVSTLHFCDFVSTLIKLESRPTELTLINRPKMLYIKQNDTYIEVTPRSEATSLIDISEHSNILSHTLVKRAIPLLDRHPPVANKDQ